MGKDLSRPNIKDTRLASDANIPLLSGSRSEVHLKTDHKIAVIIRCVGHGTNLSMISTLHQFKT